MLSFVGDHTEEIINFPNGMCAKIDFGNVKRGDFGGLNSCNMNDYRRVRLYDKDNNLISETIEENPHFCPGRGPLPDEFFEGQDANVIY